MALNHAQIDRIIDEHFAFEANDNVEGVLATLADNVEHDIVGSPTGPTHGRDATRPFYEGLFADLADGQVETLRRLYGEDFVVDESMWRGRAPGTPFGINGGNRNLAFRLLHIFEFNTAGGIARENVWVDLGSIQQQLGAS
jgi:predicted ester cyclase